jgi:hypothetical protein
MLAPLKTFGEARRNMLANNRKNEDARSTQNFTGAGREMPANGCKNRDARALKLQRKKGCACE